MDISNINQPTDIAAPQFNDAMSIAKIGSRDPLAAAILHLDSLNDSVSKAANQAEEIAFEEKAEALEKRKSAGMAKAIATVVVTVVSAIGEAVGGVGGKITSVLSRLTEGVLGVIATSVEGEAAEAELAAEKLMLFSADETAKASAFDADRRKALQRFAEIQRNRNRA